MPGRFFSAPTTLIVATLVIGVFVTPGLAQVVTVDNVDSGFSVLAGTWETGTFPTPHGSNYRWALTVDEPFAEVEWRPNLPTSGLYQIEVWYVQGTNRASDAVYNVHHAGGSTPVSVNQQANGSQWNIIGTFSFNAGSGGYITMNNDANPLVVIADAVRFTSLSGATADLTLAVSPPGSGTTTPTAGIVNSYFVGETVSISAAPTSGNVFDHWETSAGSLPASPTSASTTVTVDQNKTVTAVFVPGDTTPSFRGFWIDAFGFGFKNAAQIDEMVAMAVAGGYNAIVPEVLAYQDNIGSGHGAYWNSTIIPKATDISSSFDPLAYMVDRAQANGLEVHCWLVSFRVSESWPPSGNSIMSAHPEWLMVPQAGIDGGPATVDGKFTLDPGSAGAQEYLMSIVRELVTNYDIDGIHWDYIRYTTTNAGYPADMNYDKSTLARFHDITGRSDIPSTGDSQWNEFRRRTITEFARRAMTEVATLDNPNQPLRHTAALITWGDAPANFSSSSAYGIFQNWRHWMEMGYLDAGIPMTYYSESAHASWYRNWVDASVGWRYDRHIYTGPAVYLNSFAESIAQMQYAQNAGANGLNTYSYRSTNDTGANWYDWYPYVKANLFAGAVDVPSMPWRDPDSSTEGNVWGRVTDGGTGEPIDDATILLDGFDTGIRTDGNGYYLLTHVAAGVGGSPKDVTARFTGYSDVSRPAVLVERAGYTEANFGMGSWLPGDYDADGDVDADDYAELNGCLTGPIPGQMIAGCDVMDLDLDDDVDLEDFAEFEAAFTTGS
ncbi:MAG TPA: family 10 glycosylhydrolase [Phycisphaerae bacterium]|nr:family 10 glycosylhydrolase [Phycisphaerae bacterium]